MKRIRNIVAAAAVLGLTAASASAQSLSDYALYGVDAQTENLYRYDFREDSGSPVGLIRRADNGATMSGIKALAYVPGHQNIFAFWTDPSDHKTKLAYVNVADATPMRANNSCQKLVTNPHSAVIEHHIAMHALMMRGR